MSLLVGLIGTNYRRGRRRNPSWASAELSSETAKPAIDERPVARRNQCDGATHSMIFPEQISSFSFREGHFGIEVLDMTALGACCRVYYDVDECRLPGSKGVGHSLAET